MLKTKNIVISEFFFFRVKHNFSAVGTFLLFYIRITGVMLCTTLKQVNALFQGRNFPVKGPQYRLQSIDNKTILKTGSALDNGIRPKSRITIYVNMYFFFLILYLTIVIMYFLLYQLFNLCRCVIIFILIIRCTVAVRGVITINK